MSEFERVLISKEELDQRESELAAQLDRDYAGKNPLFIGILKGSIFFFSDLLQKLHIEAEMDFMAISSYGAGTTSSGYVRIIKDLDRHINGRHVVIVEDMVDSGTTLAHLKEVLATREPASIAICALLSKPSRRKTPVDIDYLGFEVPDEFVVGYGLDYAERYRVLPDVRILDRSVYEK
ncbi:MAG: hypoxanthine phosphoribosyltransferase [Clostridia bacterium]|nr:hypoxanthine phosphoribosyltransferase [Clostridia bacterium]